MFFRLLISGILAIVLGCISPGPFNSAAEAAAGGSLPLSGIGILSMPEWLEATPAKGMDDQANAGVQYDIVGLSGDTWHYARLVSYRMEQNLGPAAMLFGLVEANPKLLGEVARSLLEKNLAENGGRILEWSQARRAQLGGRSVPVISARLIMTEKVPLPMAATVYVFVQKDHVFAMGLFAPDSDRLFWKSTFSGMADRMRWE